MAIVPAELTPSRYMIFGQFSQKSTCSSGQAGQGFDVFFQTSTVLVSSSDSWPDAARGSSDSRGASQLFSGPILTKFGEMWPVFGCIGSDFRKLIFILQHVLMSAKPSSRVVNICQVLFGNFAYTFFNALKGELRKDQACLARSGQSKNGPTRTRVGHD